MLQVASLTKIYENATDEIAGGIRDASFSLAPGAFYTLLGPSGCGKTTTLRCIAGLEQPDRGRIVLGENTVFDATQGISVPMNRRNIGMVFQSYAIWPHMTVFENVAFPLTVWKETRYSREDIRRLVGRALETVNLAGYQERPATRLSGGEQQRVALARSIVREPALLLLDEPLSNLDAQLREEMRTELRLLQREIGVATVYVTHDQAEALALSDSIAVIDHGNIVQQGSPRDIYFSPNSAFVARFVGATNILRGTAQENGAAGATIAARVPADTVVRTEVSHDVANGAPIAVCVRPESISIADETASPPNGRDNVLPGAVRAVSFLGNQTRYDVAVADTLIQVTADPETRFSPGDRVSLVFPVSRTRAVPPETA